MNADLTFREHFVRHFETTVRPKLNPKFAPSYFRAVEQLLSPALGGRLVAEIRHKDVTIALRPHQHRTPERTRLALQRASVAFESAIVNDIRTMGDPTRGVVSELGKGRPGVKHPTSLPWEQTTSRAGGSTAGCRPLQVPITGRACSFITSATVCRSLRAAQSLRPDPIMERRPEVRLLRTRARRPSASAET